MQNMQVVLDSLLINYKIANPKAKKTMIILPGWAHTSTHWQKLIALLSPRYRYITIDLPGFGNSSPLPNNPNIPEYSQFATSLITKLNIKKPIILGHSFGGQIAMNLALTKPKNISSLILLSPAGIRTTSPKIKLKQKIIKVFSPLKPIIPTHLYQQILKKIASSDYQRANPYQRLLLSKIINFDLSLELDKIKVPTHIIWGDHDTEIPYAGKLLAEKIPNSQLTVLYGSNHNPHLNQPKQLAQTIQKIINA